MATALVRSPVIVAGLWVLLAYGVAGFQQDDLDLERHFGRLVLALGAGSFLLFNAAMPGPRAQSGPLGFVTLDSRKAALVALFRAAPLLVLLAGLLLWAWVTGRLSSGHAGILVMAVVLAGLAGMLVSHATQGSDSPRLKNQTSGTFTAVMDMNQFALLARSPLSLWALLSRVFWPAVPVGAAVGLALGVLAKQSLGAVLGLAVLSGMVIGCAFAMSYLVRLGRTVRAGQLAVAVEVLAVVIIGGSGLSWLLPAWGIFRGVWLLRRAERVRWFEVQA